MRLLVVDPESVSRRMLTSALGASGHQVDAVTHGDDALERLDTATYGGVVTELEVGGMSGLDLMCHVRDHPNHADTGVILVTYPMDIEELGRALSLGIVGYISKPVDLETLVFQVENLLGVDQQEDEIPEDESSGIEISLSEIDPDEDADEDHAMVGQVLEQKYLVEELVGAGGMGEVYRSRHVYLDRLVAVKVLPHSADGGADLFTRFIREARILARVRSTQIVEIHDFGFTPWQSPYLVMELLEGMDLDELLEQHGALPVGIVEEIVLQMARGLAAAHAQEVLHLDFKPSNVMLCGPPGQLLSPPLQVKILDFGIARFIEEAHADSGHQTSSVTGTVSYMSPEQSRGETLRPASDLYAVGAVLFEMLTGRAPFLGSTRAELIYKHQSENPPSPCVFRRDVPPYLEDVVLKLLAKDWSERFTSADDLLHSLEKHRAKGNARFSTLEDEESATIDDVDGCLQEAMEQTIVDYVFDEDDK